MKQDHLKQIDGLRGYLALWVAVSHALQLAGYTSLPMGLGVILNGGHAVEVFIVVSGFVITHLLLKGKERYGQYITRRFFRLYPIYFTCCVLGFLIIPSWAHIVHEVPWKSSAEWIRYSALVDEIYFQTYHNTLAQSVAHATMLHGLFPREILERSALTFLPAAWSISLEWQFYLLAPVIVLAVRSRTGGMLLVIVALALYIPYSKGYLGDYYSDTEFHIKSSICVASGYFAVGIASRLSYDMLKRLPISPLFATTVIIYFMYLSNSFSVSLTIWFGFFSYLLWNASAPVSGRVFQWLTASKVPLLVGSMSYSIYLVHRPVQIMMLRVIMPYLSMTHSSTLVVQLAAILVMLPIAYLLYVFVEIPGQKFGRKVAAMVSNPPAESAIERSGSSSPANVPYVGEFGPEGP
jgi:peptidoglycan/LPS O-acetylase OafA/YrhL